MNVVAVHTSRATADGDESAGQSVNDAVRKWKQDEAADMPCDALTLVVPRAHGSRLYEELRRTVSNYRREVGL